MKRTRILIGLLGNKILRKKAPLLTSIHVTKHCQLNCSYCYSDLKSLKNSSEPTTEELISMFKKLKKSGMKMIRLLGGEPLMRKDIEILVAYLKDWRIWTEITTNGYLIERNIDVVRKVDSLCLSVDGDRKTNDICRGRGSYDAILKAVRITKNIKVPIRFHGVITRYNYRNRAAVRDVGKLARSVDGYFNFSQCMLPDENVPDTALKPSDIKSFYTMLKSMRSVCPMTHSDAFFEHVENFPDRFIAYTDEDLNPMVVPCMAGRLHCFVDSDGMMYSCPILWKHGMSIKENSIKKVMNFLSARKCHACMASGEVEMDAIFDLRLSALTNILEMNI